MCRCNCVYYQPGAGDPVPYPRCGYSGGGGHGYIGGGGPSDMSLLINAVDRLNATVAELCKLLAERAEK